MCAGHGCSYRSCCSLIKEVVSFDKQETRPPFCRTGFLEAHEGRILTAFLLFLLSSSSIAGAQVTAAEVLLSFPLNRRQLPRPAEPQGTEPSALRR